MSAPLLPPPVVVSDEEGLARLVDDLAACSVVAVDTESNSLHAYRERVCLIQFSTEVADYIVDPIALPDLGALAPVFADPGRQKIFHAAEGDVIGLSRDHHFEFANIFDTMAAARSLGWSQVGLAAILSTHFDVTLTKKFQRADWRRRPLTSELLDYARLDTHYLLPLRDRQIDALQEAGHWPEVNEEFARLADRRGDPSAAVPDPAAFWRVTGARGLAPAQAAVLQAVFAYREAQAERTDCPPFKVMSEATLMALARHAPRDRDGLAKLCGLTPAQIQRHGRGVLQSIQDGLRATAPRPPQVPREPDAVRDRYDRLRAWRKARAQARGVESDVILPRTTILDLARRPPRSRDDLADIADFGPWRRQAYGDEILALVAETPPAPL